MCQGAQIRLLPIVRGLVSHSEPLTAAKGRLHWEGPGLQGRQYRYSRKALYGEFWV